MTCRSDWQVEHARQRSARRAVLASQVDRAIRSALEAEPGPARFGQWAAAWLGGTDRTEASAVSAHADAYFAAESHRYDDAAYHAHQSHYQAVMAALHWIHTTVSVRYDYLTELAATEATWCAGRAIHGPELFTDRRFSTTGEPELVFNDWSTNSSGRVCRSYDPSEA